jgi:hypothetical protein
MIQESTREKFSDVDRIDHIRTVRNELIKNFLNDTVLIDYFEQQFSHKHLNSRRLEFIKKELRDLLIAPVDLVHYAPLLLEMKQQGSSTISADHEKLFYAELMPILSRYIF